MVKRIPPFIAIISVLIGLAVASAAVVYAYFEPQSWIGWVYLRTKVDLSEEDLVGVTEHLEKTNGGFMTTALDAHLLMKLEELDDASPEYANILGFYAHQSKSSRAGRLIFENGRVHLPVIIRMGREQKSYERKLGFLYLAHGVANGYPTYKPLYFRNSVDMAFDSIERGKPDESGVHPGF